MAFFGATQKLSHEFCSGEKPLGLSGMRREALDIRTLRGM
jgi:hypothetical protein